MKILRRIYVVVMTAVVTMMTLSCNTHDVAVRTDALPEQAWDTSIWISAQDAQVVTGKIKKGNEALQ